MGIKLVDNKGLVRTDYRLATAEILYRLPDHPKILQSYIWQDYDIAPGYPVLHKFLNFWDKTLEGKLHSVRVAAVPILSRNELRHVGTELRLH